MNARKRVTIFLAVRRRKRTVYEAGPLSRTRTKERERIAYRASLNDAISTFSSAADRGQQALFAEANILIKNLLAAREVRILVHSGGAWRDWDLLDGNEEIDPFISSLPEKSTAWDGVIHLDRFVFASVRTGSVALIIDRDLNVEPGDDFICTVCHVFRLALGSCESKHGNPDKLEVIKVFQRVANRILKSRDLQEIFLQITHEAKIRLSADICGIMLNEHDLLVMKRCVGNLAAETAALRMRAGQGVGGRVLETRGPCSVEDYVQSEIISRDFFHLARAERVRSALAVPLISQDKVIGVLEVWRRQPSTFTPQNTAELATLANLASLAIENVSLSQEKEEAALKLEEAHTELKQRYEVIRTSAELQESLISSLLAGGGLVDLAEKAHKHLESPILFLDQHLDIQVCHPPKACPDDLLCLVQKAILRISGSDNGLMTQSAGSERFLFQRVMTASEHLGWVVVLKPHLQNDSDQLAITEICVTTALHQMKEHAAARALSDKLTSLVWDLLESPDHLRRLALERAKELNVEFSGEYCVLLCMVEGLDRPNAAGGLTGSDLESRRRSIADAPGRLSSSRRYVRLSALRGNELAIICEFHGGNQISEVAQGLIDEIGRRVPGATVRVGTSKPCVDSMAMPGAWKDARIACEVARQRSKSCVVAFGDVGVAGLLMSMREGADFKAFVDDKLGLLLREKPSQREVLLKSLRAFFAANCSRQAAANDLRIHQKTMVYRLDKIERMMGLDLASHEHRVLLYLALRMKDIIE
jgi:putative methionine-R-sulfoxide reductase with GAF domain